MDFRYVVLEELVGCPGRAEQLILGKYRTRAQDRGKMKADITSVSL